MQSTALRLVTDLPLPRPKSGVWHARSFAAKSIDPSTLRGLRRTAKVTDGDGDGNSDRDSVSNSAFEGEKRSQGQVAKHWNKRIRLVLENRDRTTAGHHVRREDWSGSHQINRMQSELVY